MTPPLFDDWTIPQRLWLVVRPMLRPGMVTLETGSGLSTLLLDAAGCRHTALEHDPALAAPSNSVVLAHLVGSPPWYDWEPPHAYDLVLVDGPPQQAGAREGILRVFPRLIHSATIVVIDDTHRPADRRLADALCRQYGLHARHYRDQNRGFAVLKP